MRNKFLLILFAFILGGGMMFWWTKASQKKSMQEASTTIAYGIQRLNKMVTAEQQYANFYSHKSTTSYLGGLASFNKNILLKVDVRAQASYDLNQLKVRIDSANQTIYIEEIPPLKIETFPDVSFFNMQQSKLNQFSENDLNQIKKRAVTEVEKQLDYTSLKQQAEEQLLLNLENIYLLAKAYGWKVENSTPYAKKLSEEVKF